MSALTVGQEVLQYFWDLASVEDDIRKHAAVSLVQAIVASQQGFTPSDTPHPAPAAERAAADDDGEEEEDAAEAEDSKVIKSSLARCSPVAAYCLKRLIRGLASSRQGARQGFSLALTLALSQLGRALPVAAALHLMNALLHMRSQMKGAEARDVLMGRTFFLSAVVRSGALSEAAADQPTDASVVAAAVDVFAQLTELWAKKSFLRESACAVMVELIDALPAATVARVLSAAPDLTQLLMAAGPDLTPEALWLALRIWRKLPAEVAAAVPCLGSPFMAADPERNALQILGPGRIHVLEAALKSTSEAAPRLHSVWPAVLALCVRGFSEQKQEGAGAAGSVGCPAALASLWTSVVEGGLLASSSHERKYVGLQLFQLILPHLEPETVAAVFSPNFVRCLQNNVAAEKTMLHAAAKRCFERLTAVVEGTKEGMNEKTRIAILAVLQSQASGLGIGGGGAKWTTDPVRVKADLAGSMHKNVDGDTLASYAEKTVEQLMGALAGGAGEGGEGVGAEVKKTLDHLFSLLRLPQYPAPKKEALVRRLAVAAFLTPSAAATPASTKKEKAKDTPAKAKNATTVTVTNPQDALTLSAAAPQISAAARKALGARVLALLGEMTARAAHRAPSKDAASAAEGPARDYLRETAALCHQLVAAGAAAPREEGVAGRVRMLGGLVEATKDGEPSLAPSQRAAIAHLAACLLTFSLADATCVEEETVGDFCQAVTRLTAPSTSAPAPASAKKGKKAVEPEEDPEPEPMNVILDVQLALLSASYAPLPAGVLRGAVESLVKQLADRITATGIADMLAVLAKPLGGRAGDEEEEEEKNDGGDGSELDDESDGDESDESESDEDEDDEDEDEAAARPQPSSAAKKLSSSVPKAGAKATAAEESEEEELMTDDQMFAMDGHIEAYLSGLKEQKASAKRAVAALVAHKLRVVSLLEAIARKAPDSPHLPILIAPLLDALRRCPADQPVLQTRLAALITDHVAKGKAKVASLDLPELTAALDAAWALAAKTKATEALGAAAQAALIYLSRVAFSNGDAGRAAGQALLTRVLGEFFQSKRCRLPARFFEELFLRLPEAGVPLLAALTHNALQARSEPLQLKALHLAGLVLQYARADDVQLKAALTEKDLLTSLANALLRGTRAPAAVAAEGGGGYTTAARRAEGLTHAVRLVELLRKKKVLAAAGEAILIGAVSDPLRAAVAEADDANRGAEARVVRALHRLGSLLGVSNLPALPKREKDKGDRREGGAGPPGGGEALKKPKPKKGGEGSAKAKAPGAAAVDGGKAPKRKKEDAAAAGKEAGPGGAADSEVAAAPAAKKQKKAAGAGESAGDRPAAAAAVVAGKKRKDAPGSGSAGPAAAPVPHAQGKGKGKDAAAKVKGAGAGASKKAKKEEK